MMMRLLLSICVATLVACGASTGGPRATGDGSGSGNGSGSAATLYDRLGRRDAIALVVKDFVELRVTKDNRINAFFAGADLAGLEARLTDQICQLTGGPCTYTGKDMKTAHAGMMIKESDFAALVDDLKASLDHLQVPAAAQQELIARLQTMHDAIVTAK